MLDFLYNSLSHVIAYFVIRWIFSNYQNYNAKTLLAYSIVSLFWIGNSFSYASEIGIQYFIYAQCFPFLLPFLIHFLILFFQKRKMRPFASNNKWMFLKDRSHLITFTYVYKVVYIILVSLSAISFVLLLIFSSKQGIALVMLVSVGSVLIYSSYSILQIMKVKTQKLILITGKTNINVYEKIMPNDSYQIDYDKMLNTDISFVDYVGLAYVNYQDTSKNEWHFVFKTPDEKYNNSAFLLGSDLYYRDIIDSFMHVYNARIRILVDNGKAIKLKKNK